MHPEFLGSRALRNVTVIYGRITENIILIFTNAFNAAVHLMYTKTSRLSDSRAICNLQVEIHLHPSVTCFYY